MFLISLFLVFAAEPPLYSLELEKLGSFASLNTQNLQGKSSLWVFFQTNCTSCEKQLKSLKCLDTSTPQLALGENGSKDALFKVIQKTQFQGEAVVLKESLKKDLALRQTPTVLIVNSQGKVVFRKEHAVPCENLLKEFKKL